MLKMTKFLFTVSKKPNSDFVSLFTTSKNIGLIIIIIKNYYLGLLLLFALLLIFQKDFKLLNHHSWRCKENLKYQRNEGSPGNNSEK